MRFAAGCCSKKTAVVAASACVVAYDTKPHPLFCCLISLQLLFISIKNNVIKKFKKFTHCKIITTSK